MVVGLESKVIWLRMLSAALTMLNCLQILPAQLMLC
jgi:hypothetical protein